MTEVNKKTENNENILVPGLQEQVGNKIEDKKVTKIRKKNFIKDIIEKNIPMGGLECVCGETTLHLCGKADDLYLLCYTCGFDSRESDIHTTEIRNVILYTKK